MNKGHDRLGILRYSPAVLNLQRHDVALGQRSGDGTRFGDR